MRACLINVCCNCQTTWHRDGSVPDGYTEGASPAHDIKVFVHVFDVSDDGGCTSVVPRSHKIPQGPDVVFGEETLKSMDQRTMPNCLSFACSAGTAVLIDTAIWHTALENTSGQARQSIILGYNNPLRGYYDRHTTTLRNTGHLMSREMLMRLERMGWLRAAARRRLLGLPPIPSASL